MGKLRSSAYRRPMRSHKKVLAVSSGGGHWLELLQIRPAFEGCDVVFVTVDQAYQGDVSGHKFYSVADTDRRSWGRLLRCSCEIFFILLRENPDVVVSVGAAPGYIAVRLGKLLGAKTVWLDSIANAEGLSMSGGMAEHYADLWLTQWRDLAAERGPHFRGAIL
jgi:exopolysaccharide biosynthesis glucuronosyltransferase PssD